MKYSYHPLPQSYVEILSVRNYFHLVVVGKDPFPTAPTGIPFCKPSWPEQRKRNGSGFFVLKSIGVDIDAALRAYSAPAGLFYSLAAQGIAFLNCSYHFLDANALPKKDHRYVDMALATNEPIIRNAQNVVLCGEAKILNEKISEIGCFQDVVHPDPTNRKFRNKEWIETWSENSLQQRFNLKLWP